jgi:hypothetical protein
MVCYFTLVSSSAQARATAVSGVMLPGSVAQPPFSTNVACCQELTFLSSTRFVEESGHKLELIDADWGERRHDSAVGPFLRHVSGGASVGPPA